MKRETRHTSKLVGVRLDPETNTKSVEGYAAVFYNPADPGTEYKLHERLVERIDRQAFERALANPDDVRALFNHDPDNLLARVRADTLHLSTDSIGLRYAFDVDRADADHARVLAKIERGDLSGSSFSFAVTGQRFDKQEDGPNVRTITGVELFDVGPVTFPAYQATTAGARSDDIETALAEWAAWKAKQTRLTPRERARLERVAHEYLRHHGN